MAFVLICVWLSSVLLGLVEAAPASGAVAGLGGRDAPLDSILGKREAASADAESIPQFDTYEQAWAAIQAAKEKGKPLAGAYVKSEGILITDIEYQQEVKVDKRESPLEIAQKMVPVGQIIPGIAFTERQVAGQGTYFAPWAPASCPFYNDKSPSDVRHDFTVTITKTKSFQPGFDINVCAAAALHIGAEITKTESYTRTDSYTIKAGKICQLWVQPLRFWQDQQTRTCRKTGFTATDKKCGAWGASIHGDFLVQNKTIGNLQCGPKNVDKTNCGS